MAAHRFETPTSTIDNGAWQTVDKERTKILDSSEEQSNKPFTKPLSQYDRRIRRSEYKGGRVVDWEAQYYMIIRDTPFLNSIQ